MSPTSIQALCLGVVLVTGLLYWLHSGRGGDGP